jgi:hypothetical protein
MAVTVRINLELYVKKNINFLHRQYVFDFNQPSFSEDSGLLIKAASSYMIKKKGPYH